MFLKRKDAFCHFNKESIIGEELDTLPVGRYIGTSAEGMFGDTHCFAPIKTNKVIPVSGGKFDVINQRVLPFFSEDSADTHKKLGFNHYLGVILHGKPGTGKTKYIEWLTKIMKVPTVYLSDIPTIRLLPKLIKAFDGKQVAFVIEEFDMFLRDYAVRQVIGAIGDGVHSVNNVILLTTTNHINEVPGAFKNRPTRFSVVEEIDYLPNDVIEDFIMKSLSVVDSEKLKKIDTGLLQPYGKQQ